MELTRTDQGDQTTITLAGILKQATAPSLRQMTSELQAADRKNVTLDMTSITEIDSSGVAAIVELHKQLKSMGGTLTISGLQGQPRAILNLLRLNKVLSSH